MKWRGRQRSSNIEDRRGAPRGGFGRSGGIGYNPFGRGGGIRIPTGRAGGGIGGIVGIVVVLGILWFVTGTNPLDMLTGQTTTVPTSSSQSRPLPQAGEDELADFVAVVLNDTETFWQQVFRENDLTYAEPNLVLFSEATNSACGAAQSASGPFYCPLDQRVYIDLTFYDQLRDRFGASGDFAQAYVIAHEVGHHVQQLEGTLPEFNRARAQMSQEQQNRYSVMIELQADCYAGVWARGVEQFLEAGDIDEAMNAANAIGDDRLTGGRVPKSAFTHGTSEQRMRWFRRGFETGDVGQCDTFNAANL